MAVACQSAYDQRPFTARRDLHIAAHARSEGLTLVSNNLREFERVEALQLANWI